LSGYVGPDEVDLGHEEAVSQFGMSIATVAASQDFSIAAPEGPILPTIETETEIDDSQEPTEKGSFRESQVASEATSKAKEVDYKDDGAAIEEPVQEEETPKPSRTPKKRKTAFEGYADDGGSYEPSLEESSAESELRVKTTKAPPKKVPPTITLSGIARPSKLQKTTPSTPSGKSHQAQNQRTSASRTRSRGGGLQAPGKTGDVTGSVKDMSTPPPARKLSKVSSASQEVKQSAQSPPSSPTFMGMKYENPSTSRAGSQSITPTGRINPYEVVYRADPNTEPDVPPMPPLPKSVRMPSGEIVKTTPAVISKPQPPSPAKLTKPRPASVSPKKLKESVENEDDQRPASKSSFEWPEDVF
jgi:hypothetical protein